MEPKATRKKKRTLPKNHRGLGRIRLQPKPEPSHTQGRPSSYTKEMAIAICEDISTSSRSLETICLQNAGFPVPRTVYRWLANFPDFRQMYAIAKHDQLSVLAEEITAIADTQERGEKRTIVRGPNGEPVLKEVKTEDMLGHRELRIRTRQWLLSKLDPQKYGDKVQIDDRRDHLAEILEEFKKKNGQQAVEGQQKFPEAPDPDTPVPAESQVPKAETVPQGVSDGPPANGNTET
jgi:hypothetical protein